MGLKSVFSILGLHLVLSLGLLSDLGWSERLPLYVQLLLGSFSPELWPLVWPQLLLSGGYLLFTLLLSWPLAGGLARRPLLLSWLAEGFSPFVLLALLIWAGLSYTVPRGLNFPLQPWSPLMLSLFIGSLALPVAARAALLTRQVQLEALNADFTRTARALGLPEAQVQRQAARVALPQRAASLAGETLGLLLSVSLLEGLVQFNGLGNQVYLALQDALRGAALDDLETQTLRSLALLLLLALSVLFQWSLRRIVARLDPRPALHGTPL